MWLVRTTPLGHLRSYFSPIRSRTSCSIAKAASPGSFGVLASAGGWGRHRRTPAGCWGSAERPGIGGGRRTVTTSGGPPGTVAIEPVPVRAGTSAHRDAAPPGSGRSCDRRRDRAAHVATKRSTRRSTRSTRAGSARSSPAGYAPRRPLRGASASPRRTARPVRRPTSVDRSPTGRRARAGWQRLNVCRCCTSLPGGTGASPAGGRSGPAAATDSKSSTMPHMDTCNVQVAPISCPSPL